MKINFIIYLLLISFSQNALAHGNHGGGTDVSIEDDMASGNHIHLPVRIESSGEVVFGYESPFSDHDHEQDEHEEHEGEDHEEAESEASSHSFHIAPTIVIGGDKIDRIISKDALKVVKVGVGEVSPAKKELGFVHVKSSRLLFGAGIEIHKHLNVGAFGAGLGLVYTKNQTSYSEIHLNTLQEKGRELIMPGNFSDFSKWKNEEKLSYVSSGSIIFNAGVGIDPIVHGGMIASASGTWLVKIKKLDSDYLNVSVASVKSRSFGVEVDSVIFSLSQEKLKAAEKSLNFNLNMKSAKVVEALKLFYRGDLRAIQQLATDKTLVKKMESVEGVSKGSGRSLNFNLPFLFGVGTSKYKSESFQASLNNDNGDKGIAYSSIITKDESTRGIISNHKKEMNQFATTFINKEHGDHRDHFYAANFKWHYEKDEVKASVVKEKLNQLANQIGLKSLRDLKMTQEQLGHFRISFDVSITESDIFTALNLLSDNKDYSLLKLRALKNVDDYMSSNIVHELCHVNDNSLDCTRQLKSKTSTLLEKLNGLARNVSVHIKTKKYKEAVSGFSKMGALMVKNQFVFKEILQNLLDTEISLTIEGEKVAKQKMIL